MSRRPVVLPPMGPPRQVVSYAEHTSPLTSLPETKAHFACPFWKMGRAKHRECIQFELHTMGDVGQHLKRHHGPLHYCSTCSQFFETEKELDAHIDATPSCNSDSAWSNSVVASYERHCQLAAEIADTSQGASELNRWYRTWDVLFPKLEPPSTPYVDVMYEGKTAAAYEPAEAPKEIPMKMGTRSLPTLRDHTTNQLNAAGDEYLPREMDIFGERKVMPNGQLLGGREYRCRTFLVPNRGDKLFMLATECARVLGYRDSYLLFNKNRSLYKIIASQPEKDDLVIQEILPFSYRSRQIAIVTARSMFRQFGSRVITNGRRVRDDYWETKARKQGFTEADLADEKFPGAAKAREAAAEAQNQVRLGGLYEEIDLSDTQPQIIQPGLLGAPTGNATRMPVMTLGSEFSENIPRDYSGILKGGPRQGVNGPYGASTVGGQGDSYESQQPGTSRFDAFACPYFKRWPLEHKSCFRARHRTPRSVGDHLFSKHSHTCPTCFLAFLSSAELQAHLASSCLENGRRTWKGISSDTQLILYRIPYESVDEVSQWYRIWDTVFPDAPRPDSPFLTGSDSNDLFKAAQNSHVESTIQNKYAASLQLEQASQMPDKLIPNTPSPQGQGSPIMAQGANQAELATRYDTRKTPILQSSDAKTALFTDSGYGSIQNSERRPKPGPQTVEKCTDLVQNVTSIEEDDMMTSYSAASTVAQRRSQQYVQELSQGIFSKLGGFLDTETGVHIIKALPEVVKAFAIRIGLEADTSENKDIMFFVHMHRQQIANQLETIFSDTFEKADIPNNEKPDQKGMSVLEKMDIWNSKVKDDHALAEEDLFQGVEDEGDAHINPIELGNYDKIVFQSNAFDWLMSDLRKSSLLEGHGDADDFNAIGTNRARVLQNLPTGKISRKRAPRTYSAIFRLAEWPTNRPVLFSFDANVITYSSGEAQMASIRSYIEQTWASTGPHILNLCEAVINDNQELSSGSRPPGISQKVLSNPQVVLPDNTLVTATPGNQNKGLALTVTGPAYTIAECGEQLAWLQAAVMGLCQGMGKSYTPSIERVASEQGSTRPHAISFDVVACEIQTEPADSSSWRDSLAERFVLIHGYPILRRPSGFPGLQAPLGVLLELSGASKTTIQGDDVLIQGPKKTLKLFKNKGNFYFWLDVSVTGGLCKCLGENASEPLDVSSFERTTARHVLWTCDCGKECNRDSACLENTRSCNDASFRSIASRSTEHSGSSLDSDLLSMSDSSESLEESNPTHQIASLVISDLVSGFRSVAGGGRSSGSNGSTTIAPSLSSRTTAPTPNRLLKGKKRARRDDDEDENDGPTQQPPFKVMKLDPLKYFACPFWKLKPSRHSQCIKLKMSRIRDVKQHLKRKHTPDNYCGRCLLIFDDDSSLRQHMSQPAGFVCEAALPGTKLDGISHGQSKKLSGKSKHEHSLEQQWFAIWAVIFPEHQPPHSVYMETRIIQHVSEVRQHFQDRGASLLVERLQAADIWGQPEMTTAAREQLLQMIVSRALDDVCDQLSIDSSSDSGLASTASGRQGGSHRSTLDVTPAASFVDSGFGSGSHAASSSSYAVPSTAPGSITYITDTTIQTPNEVPWRNEAINTERQSRHDTRSETERHVLPNLFGPFGGSLFGNSHELNTISDNGEPDMFGLFTNTGFPPFNFPTTEYNPNGTYQNPG